MRDGRREHVGVEVLQVRIANSSIQCKWRAEMLWCSKAGDGVAKNDREVTVNKKQEHNRQ